MNPLTNMKNQQKMNERELSLGLTGTSSSWHREYDDSAWVYVGGLPYDLTEGDVICIFSQYGEIVNINLIREKDSGKSKGFAFVCYEDQRSTILAVDNLNGAKVLGRALRVDHKHDYQVPKERAEEDDLTKQLREHGCAPALQTHPAPAGKKADKKKKNKKEKKKKKKKRERTRSRSRSSEDTKPPMTVQQITERNRAASPLVDVKSEFPDDIGNFGTGDRKRSEKHLPGPRNDVRIKDEVNRRKEVNSSDTSYKDGRPHDPQRRGKDSDVSRNSRRFQAIDRSRPTDYVEKSVRQEPSREDRSDTVRRGEQSKECRHGSLSKNRGDEISPRRSDPKKRHRRSSSSSERDDHRRTAVESSRNHRHRSPEGKDGRQKRYRRSSTSSDGDRRPVHRDDEIERRRQRNCSPDNDRRKDCNKQDRSYNADRKHNHKHHNAL